MYPWHLSSLKEKVLQSLISYSDGLHYADHTIPCLFPYIYGMEGCLLWHLISWVGFFVGCFVFFFYFLKQFFFLYDTSYHFIEAAAFKQKTINKVRLKVQDSSASMLFAAVTYYQRKKKAFIKKWTP